MEPRQLKTQVEAGRYRPEPALVAEAMLRRSSVRELLTADTAPFMPADRTPPVPEARRRAA